MTTTTSLDTTNTSDATLKSRYESVQQRIDEAVQRSGRRNKDIILVAVTKNASFDQIRDLIQFGHVDLGENRVQQLVQRAAQVDEFLERAKQLSTTKMAKVPQSIRWHMIGSLQRNKVRKVLPLVRITHSVDSLRLAEEVQTAAGRLDGTIEILIQVNASGEKTKQGVAPAACHHLIDQIDTMMNIKVRGLMTMAPLDKNADSARLTFDRCRELFEEIHKSGVAGENFNLLSMGRSSDFETAIECGSNIVRIGSAIFGPPAITDAEKID
ncbi:MAG: YggS family pyridoxal phosphate-dependent enzyme [Planctomycetota bacterium]|nr:YggS family pyridoxal phosphate-dependent enzyme [Planctomycetota bacterium]